MTPRKQQKPTAKINSGFPFSHVTSFALPIISLESLDFSQLFFGPSLLLKIKENKAAVQVQLIRTDN